MYIRYIYIQARPISPPVERDKAYLLLSLCIELSDVYIAAKQPKGKKKKTFAARGNLIYCNNGLIKVKQ